MFGFKSEDMRSKKRFLGLTYALETAVRHGDPSGYDQVIDAAAELRNILRNEELGLTRTEKVRVVKSITRAKVKAFMGGTSDSYRTFKTLDTISNDLVQLL